MNIQGITNEKVKLLEISTLNTDYCEEKYSQTAVHKCFIGKPVLNISQKNPSKMLSLNFEKKNNTV